MTPETPTGPPEPKRLLHFDPNNLTARDVLILVPVILGLFFLQVSLAVLFGDRTLRWGGLLINSAILFGYFIHDSVEQRRLRTFWLLTSALCVVHFALFGLTLSRADEWKPVWFMVTVPELALFIAVRNRMF
jgi:hypothetical protein